MNPLLPIALVVGALAYLRLYVGIDLLDESFAVGETQRLLLGDRPFLDDRNFLQISQLLTLPLFKGFQWVNGGFQGIVLFNRHLYFLLALALFAWALRIEKESLSREGRIACALLFLAYCPFQLAGLSYYTLGLGFFFFGRTLKNPFASGICDALSILSLFPMMVPVAVAWALRYFPKRDRSAWWHAGTLVVAALVLLWVMGLNRQLFVEGMSHLQRSRLPHSSFLAGGQLGARIAEFLAYAFKPYFLVVFAAVAWVSRRKENYSIRLAVFLLVPVALWWMNRTSQGGLGAEGLIIHLGLLVLAVPLTEMSVWVPSLVAALVLTCASHRQVSAAALGLLPAAFFALRQNFHSLKAFRPWVAALPAVGILVALFQMQWPIRPGQDLHEIVGGPFHGIRVTQAEKQVVENLSRAFKQMPPTRGKVLVLGGRPHSYLLSSARPAAANLWATCKDTLGAPCADYYRERLSEIGWVVLYRRDWVFEKMEDFVEEVHGRCRRVVDGPEYEMLACPT